MSRSAGVAAYSTLGHFNDPVLNTMMGWDDRRARCDHISRAHPSTLYVPNDASFNEALATTLEEEGVRRWLLAQGRNADLAKHLVQQEHYARVIDLLNATRAELRAVYASGIAPGLKREKKRAAFAALRASFASLRAGWGGHAPFEAWFERDLNNAHLASVATYFACVPGFQRLAGATGMTTCPGSMPRSAGSDVIPPDGGACAMKEPEASSYAEPIPLIP